jgi:hypothetical protein
VAPPTQDATLPADEIRVGEKVYFFARFFRVLIKRILYDSYEYLYHDKVIKACTAHLFKSLSELFREYLFMDFCEGIEF